MASKWRFNDYGKWDWKYFVTNWCETFNRFINVELSRCCVIVRLKQQKSCIDDEIQSLFPIRWSNDAKLNKSNLIQINLRMHLSKSNGDLFIEVAELDDVRKVNHTFRRMNHFTLFYVMYCSTADVIIIYLFITRRHKH